MSSPLHSNLRIGYGRGMRPSKSLCCIAAAFLLSACSTLKKPFYYEVEREGHTIYVLGTLHLGVEASELPGFVHGDFDKSRVFVSEVTREIIALTDEDTAKRHMLLDLRERIESKTRLSPRLKPSTWEKLKADAQAALKDEKGEFIEFLSPRMALSLAASLKKDDAPTVEVSRADYYRIRFSRMDVELFKEAEKRRMTLLPIDRVKQINRCLDEIYIAAIEEHYRGGSGSDASSLVRMIHAYRDGDEARLLQIGRESASLVSQPVEECVLTERNRSWAEIIRQLDPRNGPFFIAVGARHLIGQDSVLSLLEQEGFKARRVTERD
jgi:uncharacterized protein YbaP (TraB family)